MQAGQDACMETLTLLHSIEEKNAEGRWEVQ